MRNDVKEQIEQAISIMEDAVNRVKIDVKRLMTAPAMSDADVANTVMHGFTWGLANALSKIEIAQRRYADALLEEIQRGGK